MKDFAIYWLLFYYIHNRILITPFTSHVTHMNFGLKTINSEDT